MGSFVGHIDEAIFFICLAFWWMLRIFPLYIQSSLRKHRFVARLSYPLPGKRALPLESSLKVLFPFCGLLGEIFSQGVALVGEDGRFKKLSQMQHMSLYCIFLLHSFLDLLTHFKVPLPPKITYISAALCFFWYGQSFTYHSQMHGKDELENIFHSLPISTMHAMAVLCLVEMFKPYLFQVVLLRILCILILGTWFAHAAFVLFLPFPLPGSLKNPSWVQTDPHNIHATIAFYGMHLCLAIIIITIVYSLTYFWVCRKAPLEYEEDEKGENGVHYKRIGKRSRLLEEVEDDLV